MLDFITRLSGDTRKERIISYVLWGLLAVALAGSVLSDLGICSGACTDAEKYRLFGMHFSSVGIPFLMMATIASLYRNSARWVMRPAFDCLITGALGAEYFFVYVQKHIIGHYCPLCLVIAVAIAMAVVLRLCEVVMQKIAAPRTIYKRCVSTVLHIGLLVCFAFWGLTLAIAGTSAPGDGKAASGSIRQDIWFAGPPIPNVEVYFVTDWFCDYCRKAEPAIDGMLSAVGKVARYTFIDDPIHRESLNFNPFNISLLLNDKAHYLDGRKALLDLATKTKSPSEEMVKSAFAQRGLNLRMADFATIVGLTDSTAAFLRANNVTMTPAIVVRNILTGERRTLTGIENISEGVVLMTIKRLQGK